MARPNVKIPVRKTQYQALVTFAQNVVVAMTAAIADFATPNPALATITAAAIACQTAINNWGVVGARGTHNQLMILRSDALTLYNLIVAEAAYVQSIVSFTGGTYADQLALITSSGFSSKNSPSPQGPLQAVENLHQMYAPGVSIYTPKLKWKKPLGLTSPGNVKFYAVFRSTVLPVVLGNSRIGTTTKTSFIDKTCVKGSTYAYSVQAWNTNQAGQWSISIPVVIPL